MFETNEDGQNPNKPPPANQEKTAFKKPRNRAPKKKLKKKAHDSDDGDSGDDAEKENTTPARRSARTQRTTPQRGRVINSDSDSD